jgi:predicted SnoaL-like aldol condensation-catalyzing enzyme
MKRLRSPVAALLTLSLLAPAWLVAQQAPAPAEQANPTPGCHVSAKELATNKRVAMEFFRTRGAERVALADPSYKQHNPVFKKRGEARHESDYDEYKSFFSNPPRQPEPAAGPRPPQGNPFEIVTAECDIVTIVHKVYRQDPTEPPGTFYEAFTFDTFRVHNGKLVEHWDGALIQPQPAATRG